MKITIKELERSTIEEFADKHGLEMEVNERPCKHWEHGRYYAHFAYSDVKKAIMLIGEYGNGCTPDDAIDNYARKISGETLVINAGTPNRKEIMVPMLVKDWRNK